MESHDETSAAAQVVQVGGGAQQGTSRRLACERCRGQKLKCEKSNIPDCCQRCRKADVRCSFGLALPPGRRPRSTAGNPAAAAAASESTKAKSWAAASAAASVVVASAAATDAPNTDNDSTNNTVGQQYHIGHHTPAPSCSATAHSDPFDDDNMIDTLSPEDVLAAGFESSFGDQVAAWSAAMTGTGSNPSSDGLVMMDHHTHHPMTGAPGDFMKVDFTQAALHPPSPPSQPQLQPTGSPTCLRGPDSRGFKPLQVAKVGLAALVRRAAELCDNMYELRIKYHDGHSEQDPPGHFPVHMSGEVLQAADDYLRLLRCFFLDEHSGSSTPTLVSNPSSWSSYASSIAPEPMRRVAYTADRPAALTLIASYRRLLDLYLLYYQAVYEYVRDTEPAWRRNQPIWKDLHVCGAPLREFGDLHIKLVIQAAARVLEDVEGALGLPEGCRVSRKSAFEGDGNGNGVLGSVVTSRFVEQCIAEGNTSSSEQGPSIIACIREVATSLAAVLDAPVAIERFNIHSHI